MNFLGLGLGRKCTLASHCLIIRARRMCVEELECTFLKKSGYAVGDITTAFVERIIIKKHKRIRVL